MAQGEISFLREEGQRDKQAPVVSKTPEERERQGRDEERILLCRVCRAEITERSQAIVIDGLHQHTFFNPAGVMYEIGCFANASGCDHAGQPTSEFTWFTGHHWSFALCRSCGGLLGWFYMGSGASFWGLIVNRLIEEARGQDET